MAKRKSKVGKDNEDRRKKFKQQQDEQLSGGFLNAMVSGDTEGDDIEETPASDKVDWDNEEQSYELKPRATKHQNVVEGLPIKRMDGTVERMNREVVQEENVSKEEEDAPEQTPTVDNNKPTENESEDEFNDEALSPRERLIKMKEEIAGLASKLMEDPEGNISCLTRLRKMSMSKNIVLSQLSIMSLIPVFKSLAPGYKIRQLTETEKREKVTKEVARLRQFEQSLIYNYKLFIDNLGQLGKVSRMNSLNNKKITENQVTLGQLAIKACCELSLSSLRFFNNRSDLFTIIIRKLNKKPKDQEDFEIFTRCIRVLETLLVDDKEHGEISNDIVRILCKSIKDKNFRVDESVINIFLSLSILDDYNPNDLAEKPKEKLKKKERVHLSKKQKKARKEMKEIEDELEKAKQTITAEEREAFQAKILQALLKLYLEILRAGSASILSHKNDAALLMAPVLEGLSKFGKMANFDLLGDFLEVLREIMSDVIYSNSLEAEVDLSSNQMTDNSKASEEDGEEEDSYDDNDSGLFDARQIRTILLCIVTSFSLTLNHLSVGKLPISLDLSKFISALYLILSDLSLDCDLEFSHKSLRLLDPLSTSNQVEKPSVNVSTKAELLLNCLDSIFFRSKNGSVPRAVSFTKRLYLSLLHAPEKTSLATLKFIGKLVNRHGESVKGLWNTEERISGEGTYHLGIEKANKEIELERSNAAAATLWENVLLDKHYSPMVRDGSRSLMKLSKANDRRG